MKILLLGNYVGDGQESMQRFVALMQMGLQAEGHDVRVSRPSLVVGRLAKNHRKVNKWLGYLDKLIIFRLRLERDIRWADVVHVCDHSNSVYVKQIGTRPHVVTCHDLLAIRAALGQIVENRVRWSGRRLQKMITDGLLKAQHIVCDSTKTVEDVWSVLRIDRERTSLVYIGLNYPYSPMPLDVANQTLRRRSLNEDQQFLLHVGSNVWYKNRLGVLRIFARVLRSGKTEGLKLIMVGKPFTYDMRTFIVENDLEGAVVELTDVPEEDLRALYSRASLLLFPSLAEGFGWPIIEAHACGCPVVTSNRPPMNEVGGDAAVYVDPANIESSADAVVQTLGLAESLRNVSLSNAARFSVSNMILEYLRVYQQVLKSGGPPLSFDRSSLGAPSGI